MSRIDPIVRLVIPWVLVGFGLIYLLHSLVLGMGLLVIAVYFWTRKPLKRSSEPNYASRVFFLLVLGTAAILINSSKAFFPAGDLSLMLLGVILICAIGVVVLSFIMDLAKARS